MRAKSSNTNEFLPERHRLSLIKRRLRAPSPTPKFDENGLDPRPTAADDQEGRLPTRPETGRPSASRSTGKQKSHCRHEAASQRGGPRRRDRLLPSRSSLTPRRFQGKWIKRQGQDNEKSEVHFAPAGIAPRPHCSRPPIPRAASSTALPSAGRTDHGRKPALRRPASLLTRAGAKDQRVAEYGGKRLPAARSRGLCSGPARVSDFCRRGAQSIDNASNRGTEGNKRSVVQARTADDLAAHEFFRPGLHFRWPRLDLQPRRSSR